MPRVRCPEQQLDALAHLLGCLVGEGDGQHLAALRAARQHDVREAVCEHARLARSGAGQDQQRAVAVLDRLALGRVQAGEERIGAIGGLGHLSIVSRRPAGSSDRGRCAPRWRSRRR